VKKSGRYVFMARVSVDPHPSIPFPAGQTMRLDLTPTSADPDPAGFWATQATTLYPLSNVLGVANNTISVTRYVPVFRGPADPYRFSLTFRKRLRRDGRRAQLSSQRKRAHLAARP
jgi:hypothetical protein